MRQLRCLVGARVSHLADAVETTSKVSHLAQTEEGQRWALAQGYTVVGTFEDLGVSAGKTTPFERPDLGQWLAPERLHEWDVLVFSKIDRAFRSTNDCVEFAKWVSQNNKILAFAGDGVVLDYLHPKKDSLDQMMSEFFIYVGSFFAAIELNRFKTRATDRLNVLRMTDRVSHGKPPIGYRTVKHPSGKGKALERDPEGYALLHAIKDKLVIENLSLTAVTQWLNTNHPLAKGSWSVSTLRRTLSSQRIQGLRVTAVYEDGKRSGEKVVLDPEGRPIRMADPTFMPDEWEQLQAALAQRTASGKARIVTPNPLAGIGFCVCGYALARHRRTSSSGKQHVYVRCGKPSGKGQCRGSARLDRVEKLIETEFLEAYGNREMTKRVFVPGEDRSQELAQTEQSLERLRWESDNGLIDDEELYRTRLAGLIARKRDIAAEVVTPARWDEVGTGKTYNELWRDPETDRRQVLRDAGIKVVLLGSQIGLQMPDGWPEPARPKIGTIRLSDSGKWEIVEAGK